MAKTLNDLPKWAQAEIEEKRWLMLRVREKGKQGASIGAGWKG